jgi:hypothetical protein
MTLAWTNNFIVAWTNWNGYKDDVEAKTYLLLSTSILAGGNRLFTKQSQEVLCFQSQVLAFAALTKASGEGYEYTTHFPLRTIRIGERTTACG